MGYIILGLFGIVLIFVEPWPKKTYWRHHKFSIIIFIKYLLNNFNKDLIILLIFSVLMIFFGFLRFIGKF